jgi:hypothetical protein
MKTKKPEKKQMANAPSDRPAVCAIYGRQFNIGVFEGSWLSAHSH